jgi:hypothetical protein
MFYFYFINLLHFTLLYFTLLYFTFYFLNRFAGGHEHHEAVRRHRAGPEPGEAAGGGAWRYHHCGLQAGQRLGVHFHAAGEFSLGG